ncbi:unnamed protein product [Adineta steineri]|uniref:Uncharacterized protein n=1 Tax=Adineta steineri TaxID=433720 RepID=A0A814HKP8_9BILA|nr:unnamed protein product [Adineta steineri]CAF1022581.1 unnamed protein product [Adineta steineri]CAF1462558.1 unnamed protein product [Adineta steineri]CAF3962106.1 unnamed protein product [Adineta steineri]CAF4078311.1 unnamed protein product [Adineta steineri]
MKIFLLFILMLIIRIPSSSDATVLFFQKKLDKQSRFHSNQGQDNAKVMPGAVWTHFQCDSKISPFIGVGYGCYCPGAWCSNNNQCCSQMCYKKTCY